MVNVVPVPAVETSVDAVPVPAVGAMPAPAVETLVNVVPVPAVETSVNAVAVHTVVFELFPVDQHLAWVYWDPEISTFKNKNFKEVNRLVYNIFYNT